MEERWPDEEVKRVVDVFEFEEKKLQHNQSNMIYTHGKVWMHALRFLDMYRLVLIQQWLN